MAETCIDTLTPNFKQQNIKSSSHMPYFKTLQQMMLVSPCMFYL